MWTYPPRSILAAVDFGPASARALAVASALADRHAVPLVALHAETVDVPPYFTHDQLEEVGRQRASLRAEAKRYLENYVRTHAPGATPVLTDGLAVESVLAAAAHHDLVVMGTHGRRGPSRWWLGSVAERVVRDASVPVMVVRETEAAADPASVFTRIVAVSDQVFGGGVLR
jgi:nucleotide-binding universal stress UspA family protein